MYTPNFGMLKLLFLAQEIRGNPGGFGL